LTTEEQKRIVGGAVLEYGEIKQQLIALHEKREAALKIIRGVEDAIRRGEQNVVRMLEDWPTAQYLTDLLNESQ